MKFTLGFILLAFAATSWADALNLGDPAPALRPAKWIKGSPVPKFEKGRVYVVEFWATWCGPCKEAIPHLTEMAKRYRNKVDFVGVAVWEGDEAADPALPRVQKFVKAKGAQMEYRVAVDGADNHVADDWLKSSGEPGIPTAFVVDRNGKIACIVHSPAELDYVLPKTLDGTLDTAALRARRDLAKAPYLAIQKTLDAKDYSATVKTIEDLAAKDPSSSSQFTAYLYIALAHLDSKAFQRRAREYLSQRENSMDAYNMLCAVIDNEKGIPSETRRFGITLAEEGAKLNLHRAAFFSIASELAEGLGDRAAAVRYAEQTVESANGDPNCTEAFRARMRKRLVDLRAG